MASTLPMAADVPTSRGLYPDAMTMDPSTNNLGKVAVVMEDFAKANHLGSYPLTGGWYTRLRAIKTTSTDCPTQEYSTTGTLSPSPGMDQTTHKIHSIGLYRKNGGQSD